MLTATEFVIKVLKEVLGLPLVDDYYKRKYNISRNIFQMYINLDKKCALLGKSASEALCKVLIGEASENTDREELLMNFLDDFLSPNEKNYIDCDIESLVTYVVAKFSESSSHFDILNMMSKNRWFKYNHLQQVFVSRSTMYDSLSLINLIKKSKVIEAIGISINELTINFDKRIFTKLVKSGTKINMVFLDPDSKHTALREKEEELPENQIKNMTLINLNFIEKIMKDLNHPENLKIYIYDEVPRLNMIFIDNEHLILQTYAQFTRGEDCPCYYIQNNREEGVYHFYYRIYTQFLSRTKEYKGFNRK